jgi:predicted lipoprotein with Yx(FWY)xxD motif
MSNKSIFHVGNKMSISIAVMLVSVLALAACQPAAVPVTGSTETVTTPETTETTEAATMPSSESTEEATMAPTTTETSPMTATEATTGSMSTTPEATMMSTATVEVPVTGYTATITSPMMTEPAAAITSTETMSGSAKTMEASINVATDPKLGKILVGTEGMAVYVFTKDGPFLSACTGTCLNNWMPVRTQGTPKLGVGIDPTLIGTAKLADGTRVVTYNKMPLYYFAKDMKPGDVTGQGVGGFWYVVNPSGQLVGESAGMETPMATPTP